MAGSYLLPEDVTAEHARQVLDFLNAAASAEIIAEAVEFPDELDVGVRIGQRLIDRRTELQGFRTLAQVYAVPYIGPERFTEIVVSLSGARPPRPVPAVTATDVSELRETIAALRAATAAPPQARLWTVQDTAWLGQSVTVLVQVMDGFGHPMVDQPVTLTTSWGELTVSNGLTPISGNTAMARTNHLGLIELRLALRLTAPVSDAQRLALELAAGQLPGSAAWPTAAHAELAQLVQRYRAPGGDELREAIDVAFREYGAGIEVAAHRGEALARWALIPVTMICFVHDDGGERGRRHLALATHTVVMRNWLPAFLATFEEDVARDKGLESELRRAPRQGTDAADFLDDVFISVQSYVKTERGAIGQTLRNRAAQQILERFLQSDVAQLPTDVRLTALGGLHEASRTIGDGGLTMFTAVEAKRPTRRALEFDPSLFGERLTALERGAVTGEQIAAQQSQFAEQMRGEIAQRVRDLQVELDGRVRQLTDQQALLTDQLGRKADQTRLESLTRDVGAVRDALDQKADRENLTSLVREAVELRRALELKSDRSAVDALVASNTALTRQVEALGTSNAGLRTDLSSLSTSVTGLTTRVTRDLTAVGSRLEGIEGRLGRP